MSRLAVIGLTARDRVDGAPPSTGGAPLFCQQALHEAGASARLVTKVAGDDAALLEPIQQLTEELVWRPATRTAEYVLAYDAMSGHRSVSAARLGEPWSTSELESWVLPAIERCELVHLGALSSSDFPVESLALLSERHRVSLDGQGLVRPAREGPVSLERPASLEALGHVEVLKLSEEEAAVLGIEPTALSMASLGVPELVLTSGERGALVLAHGAVVEIRSDPVDVRDATGAGDGFIACYLHARLEGATAAEAGSFAARAVGAMLRRREGSS